jgi:diguanylate cyclase (GGDEF)-like protein
MPHTDAAGARVSAERLRSSVAQPASVKMHAVTASFGVTLWQPGDDAELMFGRADEALYRAKAAGRNRVEFA